MSTPWHSGLLQELAQRLYRWRGRELLGAKDVLVWQRRPGADYGEFGIAFQGDALKMKRYALINPLNNHRSALDLSLQKALGMPAEVRSGPSGVWPVRQTMSDRDAYVSEVLEAVEQLAGEFVGEEGLFEATLMPDEGAPWSPRNDPTVYYSAKQDKLLSRSRPSYVVQVDTREGRSLGADFCSVVPAISHCGGSGVVGAFWSSKSTRFLVTHTVGVFERPGGRSPAQTAKLIRECGGLLFPSLAVGQVPATNFGELVLVADVSIILPAMRPYKKRGAYPVFVYQSDVWTETTHTFLADGAVELLQELTDVSNFMYKHNFWVLGPPMADAMFDPIQSTKTLRVSIERRANIWPRASDRAEHEEVMAQYVETEHRYPYLEAKVNGVTGIECFPVAVCPRGQTKKYRRFLNQLGFTGTLLTVPMPAAIEGRDPMWDYAWAIRDALLEYADQNDARLVRLEE